MKTITKKEFIQYLKEKKTNNKPIKLFNKVIGFDIDSIFLEENNISFENIHFSNCFFYDLMLNQISMIKSHFDNCSFRRATFHRVDLEESHFEKIQSNQLSFLSSNLKNAIIKDISVTPIQLQSLTTFQTEETVFQNCYFTDKSSIIDCNFYKTTFSKIKLIENTKIENTYLDDCIFGNIDEEKSFAKFGAIIAYSKYKLMSWEIIITEDIFTSYIYTFFIGLKENLTKKYKNIVIELENTNKPSIIFHINIEDKNSLALLIIEIQDAIKQYFENIVSEKKGILNSQLIGKGRKEEFDNMLYKLIGTEKTLKSIFQNKISSDIVDFNNDELDIISSIINIPEINIIIGDNNTIGNNNNNKSISLLSRKEKNYNEK